MEGTNFLVFNIVGIESQLLSGRDSFSTIVGGKPPSNVQFNSC